MEYSWIPLLGKFEVLTDKIIFKGGIVKGVDGNDQFTVGNLLCDQRFGGGSISADIKFLGTKSNKMGCDLIFFYDPNSKVFANAGVNSEDLFSIRYFANNKWNYLASTGNLNSFDRNSTYKLKVTVKGSKVQLNINGVDALAADLPISFPFSQVGVWCIGEEDIEITNYKIEQSKNVAFVVMQFSDPFNDVYFDVIKSVCEKANLDVLRIDESHAQGLIISDIEQKIKESKLVIADITPANANVYYEVGYAHAIKKPTILLAQKETKLPFDVSGHRTLFYDNSIGGKGRLEKGLEAHIKAALETRI